MSLHYKHIIIIIIFLISIIYSFPNLYGEDPVLIINSKDKINNNITSNINNIIKENNIETKTTKLINENTFIIRFYDIETQFQCLEKIKEISNNLNCYLNLLPSDNFSFLEKIGAYPMKLGLDLRGGVHLLISVNSESHIKNILKTTISELKEKFRKNKIRYIDTNLYNNKQIYIKFKSNDDLEDSYKIINTDYQNFNIEKNKNNTLILKQNKTSKKEIKKNILDKTTSTLSNRINELGISDATIHKSGKNKITVEIPGVQDIIRAKNILGKTATLNFMMLDTEHSLYKAIKGEIPDQSKLYYDKNKRPHLIKNKSILDGSAIINANSAFDDRYNKPCINVKLNNNNINLFEQATLKNIGKQMAIIYKESYISEKIKNNKKIKKEKKIEKIISVATIMNALSSQFQITGLNIQESKDLALLLRAGTLPATITIIEEKIVGPTLGYENIKNGTLAIIISFFTILIFMSLYYRKLGLIANISLIINMLLLISVMSIIGVVLTLPGLAGIVLTIGISIDANVLIFERIKEETNMQINSQYSIEQGFKNAFSSIIDSNCTTLIIGLVLFLLGEGPIKGFAITLSIGILTSMYSSIFVTKIIIQSLLKKNITLI